MTYKPNGFSLHPFRPVVCVCYYEAHQPVTGCVATLCTTAVKYCNFWILSCILARVPYGTCIPCNLIFCLLTLHQHPPRPHPCDLFSCTINFLLTPSVPPFMWMAKGYVHCFFWVIRYWSWHWLTDWLLYIGLVQLVYSFVVFITVWTQRHLAVGSRGKLRFTYNWPLIACVAMSPNHAWPARV